MSAPRSSQRAGTLVVRDGVIVYASEGVAALIGRPAAEIVGQPFIRFIVPEQRAEMLERYQRRLRGDPVPADVEVALEQPGGGRRLVEVHSVRDGRDVLVHLRDLSQRDARRLRLDAVAALGAALQRELAEDAVHARVREGLAALGVAGALVRVEAERVRVLWVAAPPALGARFEEITGSPIDGYVGRASAFCAAVVSDGYAFSVNWAREASCFVPEALGEAVRAAVEAAGGAQAIGVRLDERDGCARALIVVGDWLQVDDVPALRLFATQLAAAIEAARTVADLSRRNAQLAVLNRVAELAGAATDLDAFFRETANVVRPVARFSGCAIFVHDEPSATLVRLHATGDARELDPLASRIAMATPLGAVVRERVARVVEVPFTGGDPDLMAAMPFRSLAWVPLVARSRAVGLLAAGFQDGPEVASASVELLSAVGAHCASAIESHRLLSDLRRRVEELALLHEIGRSLVETLDIEHVLDAGVRNLARIVDAPAVCLVLAAEDRRPRIRAMTGARGEAAGDGALGPECPEVDLAAKVIASREPLVIPDALSDPRVPQDRPTRTGGRAFLVLPLVVRERAIGAVVIADPRAQRLFTPGEVERAAAIANQLAVAAENARLYEDLRGSYAQLARAQQQLIQRERLAALGELSAVVAHEVRNPLGVIFNSLGSLRRLVRPAGDARMLFDIVEEEADRLNRIVGDLLDFARPSTPELRSGQLDRVVEEAVGAALGQHAKRIELARELDPALPAVIMDARLVRQAVLNVAVNAVQAMPRGGRITIRIRRDGGHALLDIEDTGPGMADEVRERIFEPFFTTKASGTGLGLAVVKRIVEGHGGAVSVRSAPGRGTVFSLRFPLGGPPVENGAAIG